MQTVNFKCGHCGQVMAVGRENLGQQVRCPHCQQVVMAPASESPGQAAPASPFGNLHEHEDIFINKRDTDDALFGRAEGPKLEIPREPEPSPPMIGFNGPAPDLPPLETLAPEPPHVQPAPFVNEPAPQPHWSPASTAPDAVQGRPAGEARPRERKESFVSPAFLLLIFAPTVLWALGATGIAVWLFSVAKESRNPANQPPAASPFDALIDDGDNPGVKPAKKERVINKLKTDDLATAPLPDRLKTKIGEPIVVGDLEVKPLRVYRKTVSLVAASAPKTKHERRYESLVMDLEFKNLSTEYAFSPLDNYFDRRYTGTGFGRPPLTLIQAGDKVIFGGSHKWVDTVVRRHDQKPEARQWPFDREKVTSIPLQPGESARGYVCTDGDSEATAEFLFGSKEKKPYHGPMLWRVHVRRGPYKHKGRVLSAAAVIGVEFTDRDVKN